DVVGGDVALGVKFNARDLRGTPFARSHTAEEQQVAHAAGMRVVAHGLGGLVGGDGTHGAKVRVGAQAKKARPLRSRFVRTTDATFIGREHESHGRPLLPSSNQSTTNPPPALLRTLQRTGGTPVRPCATVA